MLFIESLSLGVVSKSLQSLSPPDQLELFEDERLLPPCLQSQGGIGSGLAHRPSELLA